MIHELCRFRLRNIRANAMTSGSAEATRSIVAVPIASWLVAMQAKTMLSSMQTKAVLTKAVLTKAVLAKAVLTKAVLTKALLT